MTLPDAEFIRRFALHILPEGFVRIRHFVFLSSNWKTDKLPALQNLLGAALSVVVKQKPGSHRKCIACQKGALSTVSTFRGRAPPQYWLGQI